MEENNEPNYEALLSTLDDNQKQELETHKQRNETLLKENEERKKRTHVIIQDNNNEHFDDDNTFTMNTNRRTYASKVKKTPEFSTNTDSRPSYPLVRTCRATLPSCTTIDEDTLASYLQANNFKSQILGFYVDRRNNTAEITFNTSMGLHKFMEHTCVIRGITIPWTIFTDPIVTVSLMKVPMEMPDHMPINILQSHYGEVVSHFRKMKVTAGWRHETPTRVYRMKLKNDIPRQIKILGHVTTVIYTGQPGYRQNPLPSATQQKQQPEPQPEPPTAPPAPPTPPKSPTPQPESSNSAPKESDTPEGPVRMYVGGLSKKLNEEDVFNLFGFDGQTRHVNNIDIYLPRNKENLSKIRGYAYITAPAHLMEDMLAKNDTTYYGHVVTVQQLHIPKSTSSPLPTQTSVTEETFENSPDIQSSSEDTKKKKKKKKKRPRNSGESSDSSEQIPLKQAVLEMDPTTIVQDSQNTISPTDSTLEPISTVEPNQPLTSVGELQLEQDDPLQSDSNSSDGMDCDDIAITETQEYDKFLSFISSLRFISKEEYEGLPEEDFLLARAKFLYQQLNGDIDDAIVAGVEEETLTLLHSICAYGSAFDTSAAHEFISANLDWKKLSSMN